MGGGGTGEPEWRPVRDVFGEGVGLLGMEVPSVPASMSAADLDLMFRLDEGLRGVAVTMDGAADGPALLTRQQLASRLSGRLGYGRALHARSTAGQLLAEHRLTLEAQTGLDEAADLILSRPEAVRYEDVLVLGAGAPRLVTVSEIFERLSDSFRHAAWHDALTGLPNLRWLAERGASFLQGADPARTALLYIDLDNFKPVNDTHGHDAGDEVLAEFGRRLKGCLRAQDIAARLGGDEFIVLLPAVGEADALGVAERVLAEAKRPFIFDGHTMHLSATVGVAMAADIPDDEELGPLDALLRQADGAMLAGKLSGKQRLQRITGDGDDPFGRAAKIRRRLLPALDDGAMSVQYEPVMDLESESCPAVEAHLRWEDPELGTVHPEEFMPLAGPAGQLVPVGRWLLERVCSQVREWALAGYTWQTAVRAPSGWLANGLLAADVAAALASHGISPARLRIDVVGHLAPAGLPRAREQLDALRRLGVEVGLDGYGSDLVTLAVLRALPFDVLKLDPYLTARLETDCTDVAIVAGIVSTAHALGMRIGASEIARPEQLRAVRELGFDSAAGPLVSPPVVAAAIPGALGHEPARRGR